MYTDQNISRLLDAIRECGTIMSEVELFELAYHEYGRNEYIEDDDGNIIEVERVPDFQAVADIYTDGFDFNNL